MKGRHPFLGGHRMSFGVMLEALSWNDAFVEAIELGE
jgi:hypothetical protein